MDCYYIKSLYDIKVCDVLSKLENYSTYSIDTETTGLNPHKSKLCVLTIGTKSDVFIFHISMMENKKAILNMIFNVVNKQDKIWILHNCKFDLQFLLSEGIKINDVKIYDTLLAESVIYQGKAVNKLSLKKLALKYLSIELEKQEQRSDWKRELTDEQIEYACNDVIYLADIMNSQKEAVNKINPEMLNAITIENNCVITLAYIEFFGVKYDIKNARKLRDELKYEISDKEDIFLSQGININSPAKLKKYLNSEGIMVNSTEKQELGKYKGVPIIDNIIECKKLMKHKQNINSMLKVVDRSSSRIYASYYQNFSSTGRITCSKPNLQGIPHNPEIRRLYCADNKKKFVIADYSQMELRIMAVVANEPKMITAYNNNQDLHTITASLVNGIPYDEVTPEQRKQSKCLNFGLIYGMGVKTFMSYARTNYGVVFSEQQAVEYIGKFFEEYSNIYDRINVMKYKQEEYEISMCGRYREWADFPDFKVRCNYEVQATGADILKIALANIYKTIIIPDLGIPVLNIHDEIVIETVEDKTKMVAELLKKAMEDAGNQVLRGIVPVIVDVSIGNNWSAK